jgi:hypothetical protein
MIFYCENDQEKQSKSIKSSISENINRPSAALCGNLYIMIIETARQSEANLRGGPSRRSRERS